MLHCWLPFSSHNAKFAILTDLLLDLGLLLLLVVLSFLFTGSWELNYIRVDVLDWNFYEIVRRTLFFSIVFYHKYVMIIFGVLNLLFFVLLAVSIKKFILQFVMFIDLFQILKYGCSLFRSLPLSWLKMPLNRLKWANRLWMLSNCCILDIFLRRSLNSFTWILGALLSFLNYIRINCLNLFTSISKIRLKIINLSNLF